MDKSPLGTKKQASLSPFSIARFQIVGAILIVAALALGLIIFLNYGISSKKETIPAVLSVETVKTALITKTQINFPPISSTTLINLSNPPKDLEFLFFYSPEEIRVEKLIYENNHTGYRINYKITDDSLKNVYDQYSLLFRNRPEWKFIAGIRAANNLFGFTEWESQTYGVRVDQTYIESNKNVMVNIQLLLK